MTILTIWNQQKPLNMKPESERGEIYRFKYWDIAENLPTHRVICGFWFDPKSIEHPMAHAISYRFSFFGPGNIVWNWIPLNGFNDSRSMPNFLLDLRQWQQWYLEFKATAEIKDFSPRLYLAERVLP